MIALRGSQHLDFLSENNLFTHRPSPVLDEMYTRGLMQPGRQDARDAPTPSREQCREVARIVRGQTNDGAEDVMLLQKWNGKLLAERFKLPEMELEIERAVEQVEGSIKAKEELAEEKREIEEAATASRPAAPDDKQKQG